MAGDASVDIESSAGRHETIGNVTLVFSLIGGDLSVKDVLISIINDEQPE